MKSIQEFVAIKKEADQIKSINNYLLLISITQQIEQYVDSVIRENVRKDFKLGPSDVIKPFAQVESFVDPSSSHDSSETLRIFSKVDLRTVHSLQDCQQALDESHLKKLQDGVDNCFPEAKIKTIFNDENSSGMYFPLILKREIFGHPLRDVLQNVLQAAGYPVAIESEKPKRFIPKDVYYSDLNDTENHATLIIKNSELQKLLQ